MGGTRPSKCGKGGREGKGREEGKEGGREKGRRKAERTIIDGDKM